MPLANADERVDARTMETLVGDARVHWPDPPACGGAVADARTSASSSACGQAAGDPSISTIPPVRHIRGDRDVYRRNGRSRAATLPPPHFDRDVARAPPAGGPPVCWRSARRAAGR